MSSRLDNTTKNKDNKGQEPSAQKVDDRTFVRNSGSSPSKPRIDTHNSIPTMDWRSFPQQPQKKPTQRWFAVQTGSNTSRAAPKMKTPTTTPMSDGATPSSSQTARRTVPQTKAVRGKPSTEGSQQTVTGTKTVGLQMASTREVLKPLKGKNGFPGEESNAKVHRRNHDVKERPAHGRRTSSDRRQITRRPHRGVSI